MPVRLACAAAALALLAAVGPTSPARAALDRMIELPSGLKYIDTKLGDGAVAKANSTVVVNYTGWLYNGGQKGKKFDSSLDRGQPFTFTLGKHEVIRGWDDGVSGMKVGGKRTLIIPPDLAYGARGAGGGAIPPNATLIFEVELLKVE
ncbi:MAG TPA: FKBP-type peptidyl-prolyl cis-trans isomerase [Stellaceae bacterium]|nr:FKBP-type peptidyl-prolyl cis-trans isomerase [Stellaceae bacterium]